MLRIPALVVLALLAALTAPASAQQPAVDPRGRFVVYHADQDADQVFELYLADVKSGEVTKLNPALAANRDVFSFLIEPRGRFVVYGSDQDADEVGELVRADTKTGAVEKINAPLVAGGDVSTFLAQIDPKGRRVAYRADQDVDDVFEVYLADLKTGAVRQLNDPLVAGGDVTVFDE
jgi:Tol biopolymer transport system component